MIDEEARYEAWLEYGGSKLAENAQAGRAGEYLYRIEADGWTILKQGMTPGRDYPVLTAIILRDGAPFTNVVVVKWSPFIQGFLHKTRFGGWIEFDAE